MNAEIQYINILKKILNEGIVKEDRTGTGTFSLFGETIKHDMSLGFPLLTSKKIHIKSVLHELLWFLKGTENAQYLIDNGITIWDEWMQDGYDHTGNTWKELPYSYGMKWRDFDGVDQIQNALDLIKTDPNSRRIVVSAWDPRHIEDAALPWCHDSFQFVVEKGQHKRYDKLNLWWRQRSADWFLGVPFNIASYAFLLEMFCHLTGYKPGVLWGTFGDVHLYKNHVAAACDQLNNFKEKQYNLPILKINRKIDDINNFKFEDFSIENYESWPSIKAKVSI